MRFSILLLALIAFEHFTAVAQTSASNGKAFWRGTVDDRVHLYIRRDRIETRTISGRPYPDAVFSFTSPLPERRVTVSFVKQKGRSKKIAVIQQPDPNNDYTAIIEIYDDAGGAREYLLEIVW
ncbi:MAG: hypothetical protein C4325_09115 [Blastocatellia bacterium]